MRFSMTTKFNSIVLESGRETGRESNNPYIKQKKQTNEDIMAENKKHESAEIIQKFMRGYHSYKVHEIKNLQNFFKLAHKITVQFQLWNLIFSLRNTHQSIQQKKKLEFEKQKKIGQKAEAIVIIQKGWRGYYARNVLVPVKRSLMHSRLLATALGWRTRKIMRLNVTLKKVLTIKDYDESNISKMMNPRDLKESRKNACIKLILFVKNLESTG